MVRELGTGRKVSRRSAADKPFRTLMDKIPRANLLRALAAKAQGSPYHKLFVLMTTNNPLNYGGPKPLLSTLCKEAGVDMGMILNLFSDGQLAEGMVRTYTALPDVMGDVAEDARSRMRMCSRCGGTGNVEETVCAPCEGTGQVRVIGDKHARELLYKSVNLIDKPRGPLIEQNFDMRSNTDLRNTLIATQDFLEPPKE